MSAVMASGREDLALILATGIAKADPMFTDRLNEMSREERSSVLANLLREKDTKVVSVALKNLLASDIAVPVTTLKPFLKSADLEVRFAAAELLSRQKEPGAARVLLPLMDSDEAGRVRFLKAVALAPTEDILPVLKKLFEKDHSLEEWVPAYQALAVIGDTDSKKRIEDDLGATALERRVAATRAIGRLNGTRALSNLHTLLFDGNALVRRMAAEAIGELGQSESIEVLERGLRDMERDVRVAVTQSLAAIKDKTAVVVLSYLVSDSDPDVRKAAILGVCGLQHESALTTLRVAMEDPDPDIRLGVLKALIALDKESALSFFERSLGGMKGDEMVMLTREFKADFLPFLKKAMESDRAWAREAALRAVMVLPGEAVAFLKEAAVINRFPDTRRAALEQLRKASCDEARDVTGSLLEESDVEVRVTAIQVFVACGGSAPDKLKAAMESPDELVRIAAATAMVTGKAAPARAGKHR